jgi:RimJ/RimL family protein N-acetyltransferase
MAHKLLEGKLVRLTAEDPDTMAKIESHWWADTEYFRLLDSDPPRLFSEKKLKEWMEKDLEKEDENSFAFSIRLKDADKIIGFVALFNLNWNHGDSLVAIAIGERDYWGKGYGTDAMNEMLRYAFTELNLRRISLIVFAYNPRAQRSYEKCGFVREGIIRGAMLRDGSRWDWHIMGVLREEWQRLQGEPA